MLDSVLGWLSITLLLWSCSNLPSGIGVGARGTSWRWLATGPSTPAPTGRMVRREPEVLAATRRESGTTPKGAITLYSVLVTVALLFCGPSSPSVASSTADVLPVSRGLFLGRPRGLPVGLLRDLDPARERGLATGSEGGRAAGDGALSTEPCGLGGIGATLEALLVNGARAG